MNIIKQGTIKHPIVLECEECGCIFEISYKEIPPEISIFSGIHKISCPTCNNDIMFALDYKHKAADGTLIPQYTILDMECIGCHSHQYTYVDKDTYNKVMNGFIMAQECNVCHNKCYPSIYMILLDK